MEHIDNGKRLGRYSAADTQAGERMIIEAAKDLTVFSLVMPLIHTAALKQAA